MTMQPLGNRLIVKPEPEFSSTKLILPEAAKKNANRGTVISIGPGTRDLMSGKLWPIEGVKVGDRVMFGVLRTFPFKEDGVDYVMMSEQDLLCRLEE